MDDSSMAATPDRAKATRWAARILSALILLFWGFFIVADLLGGGDEASRPLSTSDYVGLLTMGVWMVGLVVAWKWEFIGGMMALVAFVIAAAVNPNVLSFPFLIILIAAALFLVSWWMRRDGIVEGTPASNSGNRT